MARFNTYPALSVQGPTDIALQGQRLKNMRATSQLQEFQLQQAQGAAQRQAQMAPLMAQAAGGDQGALAQILAKNPGVAQKIIAARSAMSQEQRDKEDRQREEIMRSVAYIDGLPDIQRPPAWQQERQRLQQRGVDVSRISETYSPAVLARAKADSLTIDKLFAQADAPSGYRRTEGGLEFTPGGPADPAVVGRLADAKRDSNGGVTPAQQANNAEIDQARETLATLALDKGAIKRLTQRFADTGRVNTGFEQLLDRVLRTATQRKVGDDPDFKRVYRQYYGAAPPPIPTPADVLTEFGLDDLSSLGGDTPAPRRGTSRAGGRGGPRGRGGAKAIPKMSLTEIDDLVNAKGKSLSPAELKAIQARLAELGM